ncbi:DNA-processing protein DprA, partial [Staphylococcus aureus]|nr:DNA-processing protein DprA [Staphylococcus aureus]
MLNHILLKLIWSRFTTAQIHLLLKTFPSCCEVDEYERMHILENFCKLLADKKIDAKVNRYKEISVDEIETTIQKTQLNYITCFDHNYPYLLKETYNYPIILFYKGNINLLSYPHTLAVVGSRLSGDYTLKALNHLFVSFQQMSFCVVSGLAQGADAMAHQIALKYNLPTIAVLAFGHQT